MSILSDNKIKNSLNSTVFKTFISTHDNLQDTEINRLYKDVFKYFTNIEDKNIYSIAASMIVINALESRTDDLKKDSKLSSEIILEDPSSLESAKLIVEAIKLDMKPIRAIENKKHRKASDVDYIAVVKRLIVEYFTNKRKRMYTDELIAKLKAREIQLSFKQEIVPWRYMLSKLDSQGLLLSDSISSVEHSDRNHDSAMQERFELIAAEILSNERAFERVRVIVKKELNLKV
jgi:hypothetical protein